MFAQPSEQEMPRKEISPLRWAMIDGHDDPQSCAQLVGRSIFCVEIVLARCPRADMPEADRTRLREAVDMAQVMLTSDRHV